MPATAAPVIKYTPANRPGRIINYSALNKAYVDRGRLETWVDLSLFRKPARVKGRNGRPMEYSDGLIQMLLLLKIRFNLPYRTLEGFALSLFHMTSRSHGKGIPSFGTIASRVRTLGRSQEALVMAIKALARANDDGRPKQLLIDSTGVSISTMGPWRATRPWTSDKERKKRQFVKLHIGVNPVSGMIEMAIITPSERHDSKVLPAIVDEVAPERVSSVVADGAYHTRCVHKWPCAISGSEKRTPGGGSVNRALSGAEVTLPGSDVVLGPAKRGVFIENDAGGEELGLDAGTTPVPRP